MRSHGSLFSGIGCWDYGFEQTSGTRPAFFAEALEFRRRVLRARWPGVTIFDDVSAVRAVRVDVLIGGFPCKRLSTTNVCQDRGMVGVSGEGWALYEQAIDRLSPTFVVVENAAKGGAWRRWVPPVRRTFRRFGYASVCARVSSAWFGAPHHRERAFVFAAHADLGGKSLRAVHEAVARLQAVSRPVRPSPPTASSIREIDGSSRWLERAAAVGDGVDVRVARWTGRVVRAMLDAHPPPR